MFEELKAIVSDRVMTPLKFDSLRDRFGSQMTIERPADSLDVAMAYCQLAVPLLRETGDSVSGQGADLLVRFIADLPESVRKEVSRISTFSQLSSRAWEEPKMDAYVALSCTVHDVWAHLLGPESTEDDAITEVLLRGYGGAAYDFGSGAGHFAHELAARGVQVDALEVDPIKAAFFEFRAHYSGLERYMKLGQSQDQYDLALAINVLDHLEQPSLAVEHLAALLRPGGTLYVLAAFPNDGWHQSDPEMVARCSEALWRFFIPSTKAALSVPGFDTFARKAFHLNDDGPLQRRPCMHPASIWQTRQEEDQQILLTPGFYSVPCVLNKDTSEICSYFDGSLSVEELAQKFNVDAEELLGLCNYLYKHRHLFWDSAQTHADSAVPAERIN